VLRILGSVVGFLLLGFGSALAQTDHTQEIIRAKVEQLILFKSL
jgi:hypothetical protein